MNEKRGLVTALAPLTFVLIQGYGIIFSRVVSNPYEVYSIEKKEFLAVQLLPATNTNAYTQVVDVMRWIAKAGRKSRFAS